MKGKYEYDNDFWRECEREPFTPSEIALYMLLLHEANQNRWVMPFRCNTAFACYRLTTTKQNIFKARQRLKERGLIDFTTGTGKNAPAMYTLRDLSARLPVQLSDGLPVQPPCQLPHQLPVRLPLYKDKDRDKDNSIIKARGSEISLDELERKLLGDTAWQDEVRGALAKREISLDSNADLQERIRLFFQQQRVSGRTAREEADCRNHCFNWIASQLKNHRYGTDKHKRSDPRRAVAPATATAEDYLAPF